MDKTLVTVEKFKELLRKRHQKSFMDTNKSKKP